MISPGRNSRVHKNKPNYSKAKLNRKLLTISIYSLSAPDYRQTVRGWNEVSTSNIDRELVYTIDAVSNAGLVRPLL